MDQHLTADQTLLQHEALDRTHVLAEGCAAHVNDHPFIVQRPHLARLAEAASEALGALYQAIGAEAAVDAELGEG